MTWVKLDDQFPDNPKVVAVGGDAAWLYVAGLCYCQAKLTDGRIPFGVVPRLTDRQCPQELAERLVENALWEMADGHYVVHDYQDYNRPAADIKTRRHENRERLAKWRVNRSVTTPEEACDGVTDVVVKRACNAVTGAFHDTTCNDVTGAFHERSCNALVTSSANRYPLTANLIKDSNAAKSTSRKPKARATAVIRTPDLLFEATAAACGMDWHKLTDSERGRLNNAVGQLRKVGATPEQVKLAAATAHQEWGPGVSVTPTALAANWSTLGKMKPRPSPPRPLITATEERERERKRRQRDGPPAEPEAAAVALGAIMGKLRAEKWKKDNASDQPGKSPNGT